MTTMIENGFVHGREAKPSDSASWRHLSGPQEMKCAGKPIPDLPDGGVQRMPWDTILDLGRVDHSAWAEPAENFGYVGLCKSKAPLASAELAGGTNYVI